MSISKYAPCYKCEKRVVGCHSQCEQYSEYWNLNEQVREERLQKIENQIIANSFKKEQRRRQRR